LYNFKHHFEALAVRDIVRFRGALLAAGRREAYELFVSE
jgi:hypothetical protein